MTTAELIDAALTYYLNQGSVSLKTNEEFRKKVSFLSQKVARRAWNSAPYWFKDSSSTVTLTSGVGTMPTDFSHMGTQGQIYINNVQHHRLAYKPPYYVRYQIQNIPQSAQPWIYTFESTSAAGVPKILCYPTDSSTLTVLNYSRLCPELIDAPLAPNAEDNEVGGNPNGTYTYRMTNVTASGETEGGQISGSVTVSNSQISVALPLSWHRTVTSRKLYRTVAGGVQHKLVATISDNLTTTYVDDIADGSLGADVPTPATAFSGTEVFPVDFHDSVFFDGIVFLLAGTQDDGRMALFFQNWDKAVKRMWEEIRPGRNEIEAAPSFPGPITSGHPVWSRWTPPS